MKRNEKCNELCAKCQIMLIKVDDGYPFME